MNENLDLTHVKTILETALLTSAEPLTVTELKKLFDDDISSDTLRHVLETLQSDWQGRGVELGTVHEIPFVFTASPTWPRASETAAYTAYTRRCTVMPGNSNPWPGECS